MQPWKENCLWKELVFFFTLRSSILTGKVFKKFLGKGPATKSDEFLKKCQGGGVIFNIRIYIADFGNFKQGLLSMKLVKKSNFRVQGMFFN